MTSDGEDETGIAQKPLSEVMDFARRWAAAGESIVQAWEMWEAEGCAFFGLYPVLAGESGIHGMMSIVRSVCFGTPEDVKRAARELAPSALRISNGLLGHLPPFSVVLEAELRFRAGALVADWSLQLADGKLVVRSEFRHGRDAGH